MQEHYQQKSRQHGTIRTQFSHKSNTPEKQDLLLKSYVMMLIEDFKNNINNFRKEIQENMGQQVEALKKETQKSLKEIQ